MASFDDSRATSINLISLRTIQMRTFHMTWFAFFLAFFGWFGIAPLMPEVRDDLGLTNAQIGNTVIASVLITVVARIAIGYVAEMVGPRRTYAGLLIVSAIPVMCIGLADSYETFLLFRLAIGVTGAAFVVTQYHTSLMFAPSIVGTANATTAGWGNLGGGVTQMVMPLVLGGLLLVGVAEPLGWRVAMVVPGLAMALTGVAYYIVTRDTPDGDLRNRAASLASSSRERRNGRLWIACRDRRVWALFIMYGACFGIELTINNIAALYYHDRFGLNVAAAGAIAGLFGLMNIFARTLGGYFGDRFGRRYGINGRVSFLGAALLAEGLLLVAFASAEVLVLAIPLMVFFSVFVQMAEGATFAVVPFIRPEAVGSVSGIVGAGGNMGAVLAGLLFRTTLNTQEVLFLLGVGVILCASLVVFVRQRSTEGELANVAFTPRAGAPALSRVVDTSVDRP